MNKHFLSTLETPRNISPELRQAVMFLTKLIIQMDIDHRLDFARRDDRMKRFFFSAAARLGVEVEEIHRIYEQADRDRAANDEKIVETVFDEIREAGLGEWFKKQFGETI